ncbi:MAG: hypothetical protein IPH63_05330 [Flavobacteriales bacterium]|nr:hypothetical protein [Flavobacteriales bacterium]
MYTGYSFSILVNISPEGRERSAEFGSVQRAYILQVFGISTKFSRMKSAWTDPWRTVNGITDGANAQHAGMEDRRRYAKGGSIDVNNVPQLQEQVQVPAGQQGSCYQFRNGLKNKFLSI